MATKKLNGQEPLTGLTRNECINLYYAIRDIKSGGMSKDGLIAYIMLRLKLKDVAEQFNTVRQEVAEQTKPEGWQEGDNTEEWDKAFAPVMNAWLQEATEIDSHVLAIEDCAALMQANPDMNGGQGDIVVESLMKPTQIKSPEDKNKG